MNDTVIYTKEIKGCMDCPYVHSERHYTADSFEFEFEWKCVKADRSLGIHDWHSSPKTIPTWCPLRKKD